MLFKKIIFWLDAARLYSLPITILSWLVIFIYSAKHGGNIILGIIALIGICFVHLATNLTDDYFDYKILSRDEKFLNSAQDCKCAYLKTNNATMKELLAVIIIFLTLAAVAGIILFLSGRPAVSILALIALIIALSYQQFSLHGLGEIAVIIAYGPLLFEGVYYVMTGQFSTDVLILSFACVMFVNTILYAHMLMDFDGDECAHKKTLCRKLKTKDNALNFILVFYALSLILTGYLAFHTGNKLYFLTYLTVPLIIDLYKSLQLYNIDKTILPAIRPCNYPLDN